VGEELKDLPQEGASKRVRRALALQVEGVRGEVVLEQDLQMQDDFHTAHCRGVHPSHEAKGVRPRSRIVECSQHLSAPILQTRFDIVNR